MAIPILMPALSPTMTEGNLAKWCKKEGEKISSGQIMAEIETDKAIMEMEAVDGGTLGKILVAEGTSGVKVNTLIAVLLEAGEDASALEPIIQKYSGNNAPSEQTAVKSEEKVEVIVKDATSSIASDRIFASPLAKRIAGQNNVNISNISGSGPHGRIIKSDIEAFMANSQPATRSSAASVGRNPQEFTKFPVSGVRKIIAKRLLESKQTIPHFYVTVSCQLDELMKLRQQLNDAAPQQDGKPAYKISVNDLIIKASAKAMHVVPTVNSSWDNDNILQYNNIDIAVAVSTDGGLITPIIRNADQKSVIAISEEMKSLAARARVNKLKPEEFQGGGFSISNLGMFGIKQFNAIVNPPQSCIMAVGAGIEQPVVKNGQIVPATVMDVTLSCDHRVVDGAVAAEFATAFKKFIETPVLILI